MYSDLTSIVAKMQSLGGVICSIILIAWVLFIRRCGMLGRICFRASSSVLEVSVGPNFVGWVVLRVWFCVLCKVGKVVGIVICLGFVLVFCK